MGHIQHSLPRAKYSQSNLMDLCNTTQRCCGQTHAEAHDVQEEAEMVGFLQHLEEKAKLIATYNYWIRQ